MSPTGIVHYVPFISRAPAFFPNSFTEIGFTARTTHHGPCTVQGFRGSEFSNLQHNQFWNIFLTPPKKPSP